MAFSGIPRDWSRVAAETSRVARAELPEGFAGIAVDAAAGVDGRVSWVDRSQTELDATHGQVLADLSWFGPDVRRNVVEVGVRSFTTHHVDLVERRYGPAVKLCGPDPEGPISAPG